jgi:nucleoside-diphosphate-sugar epimerase
LAQFAEEVEMAERIFVTGATGLVGHHVVKHLLSKGFDIVACVRASSKTEELNKLSGSGRLELAVAELSDTAKLTEYIRTCAAVIHCAGAVDPHARREDIMQTNVEGTRSAINAAIASGARQFIHISSLSVITGQADQYNVDETAPLRYCGEAYADSKVDAEKVVLEKSGVIGITILRPGFIYGPGERAWMPRLIGNLRSGKVMLIDGGTRQTNVIYVENLARAVELALFNERSYGQQYNLTDEKTPTKKELFDAICEGLNIPKVTKTIPRPVVEMVCNVVSVVAPFLPAKSRQGLSRFSRAAFRLAGVNQGFSTAKAQRELGYTNIVPFEQGMKETLRTFAQPAVSADHPQTVSTR